MAPLALAPLTDGGLTRDNLVLPGLVLGALLAAVLARRRRTDTDLETPRRRERCALALVFLASYLVFVGNERTITAYDCLPNRLVPLALLRGDGLELTAVAPPDAAELYSLVRHGGGLYSAYPLGTALLATPYYAAARLFTGERELAASERHEKHAAALLAALAIPLFVARLRRLASWRGALLGGATLAFGTQVLLSMSQGLWSLTGELLALALAFFLLDPEDERVRSAALAGAAAALAFHCRPTAVVLLPFLAAFAPRAWRTRFAAATAFAVVALAGMLLALAVYGHPLGGYAATQFSGGHALRFGELPGRLAGVLVSPSRGLLWFFPLLPAAAIVAWPRTPDRRARLRWLAALTSMAGVVLLNASWTGWWGGHSLGPRLLAEISLPVAYLAAVAFERSRRRATTVVLGALLALQIAVHAALWASPAATGWNRQALVGWRPAALWSLRDSQLAAALVPGWQLTPPYLRIPSPQARDPWLSLDLAPIANATYGREPGPEGLALPRLAGAPRGDREATRFRFPRPGERAIVRACAGESTAWLQPPKLETRVLDLVLVWRPRAPVPDGTQVATLLVERPTGRTQRFPLRAGAELFAADPALRASQPPARQLVAGKPAEGDALVVQSFPLPSPNAARLRLRLEVDPGADGCLYWLAASARRAPARPHRKR